MYIPREIWDKILIESGDLKLAILYKNEYVINNLFDEKIYTYYWCIIHDNLEVFDFLVNRKNCSIRFKGAFVDAIWFNNFQIAEYIIDKNLIDLTDPNITDIIHNCCVYKISLETILFFERYNLELDQFSLDEICGNCDILTLMYLLYKGHRFTQVGILNTVRQGNINNFDVLISRDDIVYDNEYNIQNYLMDIACENYRFDMMYHLYYKYNLYGSDYILEKAALTRSQEIIKWVYKTHEYTSITPFCRILLTNYFSEQELVRIGINISNETAQ